MQAALLYTPGGGGVRLAKWSERALNVARKARRAGKIVKKGEAAERAARAARVARAARIGKEGEAGLGALKNTTRIASALDEGAYRVPDILDRSARIMGEIKNVANLSYIRQIRDYVAIAQREGYRFDLFVRRTTKLSSPLRKAIAEGRVNLRYLP